VSILQSAQTWKITLLTVVDTLARRRREKVIDGQIDDMDFDEMGKSVGSKGKASASVIDGIEDGETRRRLLLKIADGMDAGEVMKGGVLGSPPKRRGGEDTEQVFNSIRMLRMSEAGGGGAAAAGGGDEGSPLPGLFELGLL